MCFRYALENEEEALAFASDSDLSDNFIQCVLTLHDHYPDRKPEDILGHEDFGKYLQCLLLFAQQGEETDCGLIASQVLRSYDDNDDDNMSIDENIENDDEYDDESFTYSDDGEYDENDDIMEI